jgi:hypothetical protein
MNAICSNERDYHQLVIDSISRLPDVLKTREGLGVFVWGHEIRMHDAGRGGGDGSADLLTVDEEGLVWLIEVKFGYTSDLTRFVWGQLARYKQAVGAMSWQRFVQYSEAFLKGRECTKPTDTVSNQALSFAQAIETWQRRIGRTLVRPDELNARIANALKAGTYGIMVLADQFVEEVEVRGREFQHDGPLAYVQGLPTEAGIEFQVRWRRPATGTAAPHEPVANIDPRFDAWEAEVNRQCSPVYFADTLGDGARDLWVSVLRPGLLQLGWDGRAQEVKRMAFNVGFVIRGALVPLLVVGWSELDAKDVPRSCKLAGKASMKVNPRMRRLLEASGNIDFVNRWAERFYQLGWRGRPSRGMDKRWGKAPITEEELRSVEGVMIYRPAPGTRDHNGRPGDRESIEQLLREFGVMLAELRGM